MLEVSNAKNIYSLEIREADSSGQFLQQDDEYLNFRASLKDFIFYATGQASLQRIIFSGNIKSPFLWVNFSSAGSTQSRNRSEVLNALMKIYNFEISKTSQVKDVYEIQATRNLHLWPNDRISEPATLKKITVGRDLTFAGDNQEVKAIANFLESRYNVIVIDSTNITGEFDWEIPDTPFDKLNDLLMKDYGLQLITGSKPIEITVVNFKN
jgi:hypothetical protein